MIDSLNPEVLGFLDQITLGKEIVEDLTHDMNSLAPMKAAEISGYVRDKYGVDLTGNYAGIELPHPLGKGAGQLSMTEGHVRSDFENGLAYTVLKSAVGVTENGDVGIEDWRKSAPKMVVEKRKGSDGREGWTVTWKGRGWDRSFGEYLELYSIALKIHPDYPVIPSLMVDVTNRDRAIEQARYCLGQLSEVHISSGLSRKFLVEIDISPTLNLLPGAEIDEIFLEFVKISVNAFYVGIPDGGKFVVKIPNAGRGLEFQVRMVAESMEEGKDKIGGLIIGNRLFDADTEFEGQKGVAHGGWDLSNANLLTLGAINETLPLTATGNICTGRMMAEYALRGCTSGQIHTFFQLPPDAYRAAEGQGGRVWRALRDLIYHPGDGLIAVLLKLQVEGYTSLDGKVLSLKGLQGILPELV